MQNLLTKLVKNSTLKFSENDYNEFNDYHVSLFTDARNNEFTLNSSSGDRKKKNYSA